MARTPWDPAPGDVVYLPYNPRRVGLIEVSGLDVEVDFAGLIKRVMPGEGMGVIWDDGEQTIEWASHLSSFDALIATTERKLAGHLERRQRLEQATGAAVRTV